MKVVVEQKVLIKLLERGGMAALSEGAQADTSNRSLLIKSVHIKVADDITVSSASSLVASRYNSPIGSEHGIDVKDSGEIVVPAKELYDWVSKQRPNSQIGIVLKELDVPELLNVVDSDIAQESDKKAIKRTGTITVTSKDQSKTGAKWSLNCYDSEQLPSLSPVLDNSGAKKLFEIEAVKFKRAVKKVKFAAEKTHYQHLFDSICISEHEDALYALTTDKKKVALYRIADSFDGELKGLLPIPVLPLNQFIGFVGDGEKIVAHYDEAKNKVFLSTDDFIIRTSMAEKDKWAKIPPVKLLKDVKYEKLGKIPKDILTSRLVSLTMATNTSALFTFAKDSLVMFAQSEVCPSPMITNAPVEGLTKDVEIATLVSSVLGCLKAISDEDATFHIADNENSLKIVSDDDESFTFYVMAVNKGYLVENRNNAKTK
mgnify:CR=1 FL=1|tara:strand:- start:16430 stop:17719 length:1290 start_codon:yes stop_codon:yes gene_type:complete